MINKALKSIPPQDFLHAQCRSNPGPSDHPSDGPKPLSSIQINTRGLSMQCNDSIKDGLLTNNAKLMEARKEVKYFINALPEGSLITAEDIVDHFGYSVSLIPFINQWIAHHRRTCSSSSGFLVGGIA